ncbi:MAG TPA: thioredoxin family protein [Candidatus Angelobacter sp.]|nr:thioredoxin family protein [Candidatus Angelobacter sp.]
MKVKWLGVILVLAIVGGIIVLKARSNKPAVFSSSKGAPQVLLVATSAQAASRTRCGQIVRLIRAAGEHGVNVEELAPDSPSDLIGRYHVMKTPTVLIFAQDGTVKSRFEGEKPETLAALQSEMQRISR